MASMDDLLKSLPTQVKTPQGGTDEWAYSSCSDEYGNRSVLVRNGLFERSFHVSPWTDVQGEVREIVSAYYAVDGGNIGWMDES